MPIRVAKRSVWPPRQDPSWPSVWVLPAWRWLPLAPLAIVENVRAKRVFERERDRVLAELDCDLSEAGEHVLPVRVDYRYGHGLKLLVLGPPRPEIEYEPTPWLKGLQGVAGLDRAPFESTTGVRLLVNNSFASGPDGRALARLPGSPPGEYQVRVVVTDGARGLAGVPHRLVVMNDVCGCELMGPAVLVLGAFIAATIGSALCVWSAGSLRRAGRLELSVPRQAKQDAQA